MLLLNIFVALTKVTIIIIISSPFYPSYVFIHRIRPVYTNILLHFLFKITAAFTCFGTVVISLTYGFDVGIFLSISVSWYVTEATCLLPHIRLLFAVSFVKEMKTGFSFTLQPHLYAGYNFQNVL